MYVWGGGGAGKFLETEPKLSMSNVGEQGYRSTGHGHYAF